MPTIPNATRAARAGHEPPAPPPAIPVSWSSLGVEVCGSPIDEATLILQGEVDLNTAGDLLTILLENIERGAHLLTLDVSGVTYLDSSGLKVLTVAFGRLKESGGSLDILNPRPIVRRVLEISGFDRLFQIRFTRDETERH